MDFFFGPVLICTISSNISNDSTQLKFSFNIFLWKICRQYPRAEVLLLCLCFPWPPDEHQIVQFILAFKGTATCLHWIHQEVVPLFASDHSWQKGKHFGWRQVLMFMVSHQTLHWDANLFVASPWEVEPNQCTEAGQVVYGILIYYLCAACPKHFVHPATTAITAQAT